jgi:FKBP-type peptidyl-prolyl cis-trans isomerase
MTRLALPALAAALALAALPARAAEHGARNEGKPAGARAGPGGAAPAEPDTLYGIGLVIARNLEVFDLSKAELEQVLKGVRDAHARKARFKAEEKQPQINALAQARMQARTEREKAAGMKNLGPEKEKGAAHAEKLAKEKGAVRTASGLVYVPLVEGTGTSPTASSTVRASYEGRLVDGTVFDASAKHGGPMEFPLSGVIPCWTEALQKMKVGGKARIVCPSSIAYGDEGRPGAIPPGATLTFDVELVEVK